MSAAATLPAGWCVPPLRSNERAQPRLVHHPYFAPPHPTSNLSPHQDQALGPVVGQDVLLQPSARQNVVGHAHRCVVACSGSGGARASSQSHVPFSSNRPHLQRTTPTRPRASTACQRAGLSTRTRPLASATITTPRRYVMCTKESCESVCVSPTASTHTHGVFTTGQDQLGEADRGRGQCHSGIGSAGRLDRAFRRPEQQDVLLQRHDGKKQMDFFQRTVFVL